jgi:hypothetical protein
MNSQGSVGIATPHGAEVHPDCDCALCRAHRDLEQSIADAERRSWILNPWFLIRKLNGPEPAEEEEEMLS